MPTSKPSGSKRIQPSVPTHRHHGPQGRKRCFPRKHRLGPTSPQSGNLHFRPPTLGLGPVVSPSGCRPDRRRWSCRRSWSTCRENCREHRSSGRSPGCQARPCRDFGRRVRRCASVAAARRQYVAKTTQAATTTFSIMDSFQPAVGKWCRYRYRFLPAACFRVNLGARTRF